MGGVGLGLKLNHSSVGERGENLIDIPEAVRNSRAGPSSGSFHTNSRKDEKKTERKKK